MSPTRVRAVLRKELREYRRNGPIIWTMAFIPAVFVIPPLINIFSLPSSTAPILRHSDLLLYLMGIPALVPAVLAGYSVVGEREQGTLEPILTTPIRREEFLLGKALAVMVPALIVSYAVFALSLGFVELFAKPTVAPAVVKGPEVLAQVVFTPLLATWSICVGIAVSSRARDVRVAQQLASLASLPLVAVSALIAFGVIHPDLHLALGFGIGLLVADRIGWRVMSAMFDRERLVVGTKS